MTNQLDDDASEVMNEGRGLCRVLAVGVLLAVATVAGCVFTGCALLDTVASDERVQAEFDRAAERIRIALEKPDDGGTVETPTAPTAPTAPQPEEPTAPGATVDAVAYSALNWNMGGFNGSKAVLHDGVEIGGLNVGRDGMSYRWVRGGCEQLGAGSRGDASKTLACMFYRDKAGKWQGGKFDWISTSRTTRDFKNIHGGYNGWNAAEFDAATEFAFVVVSADGKRRSNVVIAEAR
jgi:hypothetical protein